MKIEFKKVVRDYLPISLKQDSISVQGKLKKLSYSLVEVDLNIYGIIEVDCAICASKIELDINENIQLKVCNGYFKEQDLDVIECFDGIIDLDHILKSEVEAIMCDYHYCNNCK